MKIGTVLLVIGALTFIVGLFTFGWFTLVPLGAILFIVGLVMVLGSGTAKVAKTVAGDKRGTGRL